MPNSPTICNSNTQNRICDFCSESVALLYCRADSAKLCLSCDREVHTTNQLFTKHTRSHLCDSCNSSPASIFCCTDNSVLCQNCDYELHTQLGTASNNHDRRPLEGFTGCPSVAELSGVLGFGEFDAKSLDLSDNDKGFGGGLISDGASEEDDGFSDLFVWDVPTMVNLDDLIVSTDRSHDFQAMVVPPLPKERSLSCGQHKHEMFHQLRELGKSEPPEILLDANPVGGSRFVANEDAIDSGVHHMSHAYQHEEEHPATEGNEASPYNWNYETGDAANDIFLSSALSVSHIEECGIDSDTHSGMCSSANLATNGSNSQYLISTESPGFAQKVSTRELCTVDRGSAISRYKEKKRTRRFQKHIRYESRKVQAENRTRIKGRFAKVNNCKNLA